MLNSYYFFISQTVPEIKIIHVWTLMHNHSQPSAFSCRSLISCQEVVYVSASTLDNVGSPLEKWLVLS